MAGYIKWKCLVWLPESVVSMGMKQLPFAKFDDGLRDVSAIRKLGKIKDYQKH